MSERDSTPAATGSGGPSVRLVVISAGTGNPSTTRMLSDRLLQSSLDLLKQDGVEASAQVIELATLAVEIARATVSGLRSEEIEAAIERVAAADAVIVATPVYKGGISGLFKSFVDLLDNDLLVAKPVLLAATAGTPRHALVIDEQMRPLFAFMRALTLPTAVFAGPEDWAGADLTERIRRAAAELTVIVRAGIGTKIAERTWAAHRHEFGGDAARAERSAADVDFDSRLMRLAAGGGAQAVPDHPS